MTEVVILVVSSILLLVWLLSLRNKARELRRQRTLVAQSSRSAPETGQPSQIRT